MTGRHGPIAHDAEPQEDTVSEPTDELRAFVLGLVDRPGVPPAVARELADSITAWAEQHARERAAEELDDVAALIDRGPTFSMPPSIYSALVRERAQDIRDTQADATRTDPGRC